jgi:hypothetical protein
MDLLDLPQLAAAASLPNSVARYYRDRFILFVPSVRIGRAIMHPPEAAEVMRVIARHAAAGMDAQAIQAALEDAYPVTAISATAFAGVGSQATGLIPALAMAREVDRREARLHDELRELRSQLAVLAVAAQPGTPFEVSLLARAAEEHAAELSRLHGAVEALSERLSQLASREQLEWIGDVVAAAALRPPQGAVDAAIERRLSEILELLRIATSPSRQGHEDLVAQLGEQTKQRDAAIQEAFNTLVRAIRHELESLRSGLTGVQRAIEAATVDYLLTGEAEPAPYDNGTRSLNGHAAASMPVITHASPEPPYSSRSPRRLGQPLRPAHGQQDESESDVAS